MSELQVFILVDWGLVLLSALLIYYFIRPIHWAFMGLFLIWTPALLPIPHIWIKALIIIPGIMVVAADVAGKLRRGRRFDQTKREEETGMDSGRPLA